VQAAHEVRNDLPEECWPLFQNELADRILSVLANIPSFRALLATTDYSPIYAAYRRQLQLLLLHFSGDRLVVKSPFHLYHLDELFRVFPDACVAWLHRDPLKTVPSISSLVSMNRRMWSDNVDPKKIGQGALESHARGIERATAIREGLNEEQLCDVAYQRLIKDPIGAVGEVYRCAGLDLSQEARANMERWLELDARIRRRRIPHTYQLETFGLDRMQLDRKFTEYRRRFSLPNER
jgi:hypothetical protein